MTSKHWRLWPVNGTVNSTAATAHREDEAANKKGIVMKGDERWNT
jgi:hypothetical protein